MDDLLEEEQERIIASLSQVLPGLSSEETLLNLEEMEKVNNEGRSMAVEDGEEGNIKPPNPGRKSGRRCKTAGVKRKRGRPKKKRPMVKKRTGIRREENDSGIYSPNEVLKPVASAVEAELSDSDASVTSLESVSLLQIATHTATDVDDVSEGVNLAWNVKVFPPLDDDEEEPEAKDTTDKAVQTVQVPYPADGSVMRSVSFISSVIRLKQMFSSKTSMSRKELKRILEMLPEDEELEAPSCESSDDSEKMAVAEDGEHFVAVKRRKDTVSCETVRYIMRRTNAEDVVEKSVDAVLVWLKEESGKDWVTFCSCWKESIGAVAVDVINEAVESDVIGIRKKVSDFLGGILDEIYDGHDEDTVQEFKVAFLSNFCKSILLQYDMIISATKKLSSAVSSDWANMQHEIATAKKTYFILRLLEDLLRSFLTALNTNQIEEIFLVRPKHLDTGVLNMWKAYWRRDDAGSDDTSHLHSKYMKIIHGWCSQTDQVLSFAMNECPLLSLVAQKCSSMARDILSKVQALRDGKISAVKFSIINDR